MSCVHLTHLERAAGTICPQCVVNGHTIYVDPEDLRGARPGEVRSVPFYATEELAHLARRRRIRRRRVRGVVRFLLPWLATAVMITSFVFIIAFINLLTNAQNGAS